MESQLEGLSKPCNTILDPGIVLNPSKVSTPKAKLRGPQESQSGALSLTWGSRKASERKGHLS